MVNMVESIDKGGFYFYSIKITDVLLSLVNFKKGIYSYLNYAKLGSDMGLNDPEEIIK